VQGRDIGPLLAGRALEPAPALCELLVERKDLRVLRTNELKAFRNAPSKKTGVFDLVNDPRETKVLHDEPSQRLLEELEKEIALAIEARKQIGQGVREIDVDAEMEERLRALGYVGEEDEDN
jgi:hypothetical protein